MNLLLQLGVRSFVFLVVFAGHLFGNFSENIKLTDDVPLREQLEARLNSLKEKKYYMHLYMRGKHEVPQVIFVKATENGFVVTVLISRERLFERSSGGVEQKFFLKFPSYIQSRNKVSVFDCDLDEVGKIFSLHKKRCCLISQGSVKIESGKKTYVSNQVRFEEASLKELTEMIHDFIKMVDEKYDRGESLYLSWLLEDEAE